MIIVEGPDGAGKTTLVQQLVQEFPQLVIGKRGTDDRSKLYEVTVPDTLRAVTCCVNAKDYPPTIWDRLFYSEFVYAPLGMPPRTPMFNGSLTRFLLSVIEATHAPVVLCLPPLHIVQKNMEDDREQMAGVRERIAAIHASYYRMWKESFFPFETALYDYSAANAPNFYEHICETIKDYLAEREERAQ